MYSLPKNVYRERIDFSKIKTTVPIPNLIEIQKKSYERFLQMNRLPRGARGRGSAVGVQVGLPDQRLPRELVARVHRVLDRQLGVQVRQARRGCTTCASRAASCGAHARRRSVRRPRGALPALRQAQPGARRRLRHLRQHGRAEAEVRRRRVPGARHDLRRAAEGDDPARGLEQGPRDRRQDHPRHQGAGGLLRRHPADDGERHVHHQRHRARHRQRSCTGRRAPSSTRKTRRSTSRRSSRIAARGWSSSTTRRTCSTSASTASGSSSRRCSCAPSGCAAPTRSSARSTRVDRLHLEERRDLRGRSPTASSGCAPPKDIEVPARASRSAKARRSPRTAIAALQEGRTSRRSRSPDAELEGAFAAADVVDPSTGEVILEANEALDAARHLDGAGEERSTASRSSSPSATRSGRSSRRR